MKETVLKLQLQIASALRHFLMLMSQRHQPALITARERQPLS